MSIAVVGLLGGISGALRNAARLRDYDRVVQLGRLRMNDILADPGAPLSGTFDADLTGGLSAGWAAQVAPFEAPPAPARAQSRSTTCGWRSGGWQPISAGPLPSRACAAGCWRHEADRSVGQDATCAAIDNRRACRLSIGTQLIKLPHTALWATAVPVPGSVCRQSTTPQSRQAGVTLIEVLIAVTLLSALSVAMLLSPRGGLAGVAHDE